jgi:hypothetical protein
MPADIRPGQSLGSNMCEINSIWWKTGFQPRRIKMSAAGGFQLNPLIHPKMEALRLDYSHSQVSPQPVQTEWPPKEKYSAV